MILRGNKPGGVDMVIIIYVNKLIDKGCIYNNNKLINNNRTISI